MIRSKVYFTVSFFKVAHIPNNYNFTHAESAELQKKIYKYTPLMARWCCEDHQVHLELPFSTLAPFSFLTSSSPDPPLPRLTSAISASTDDVPCSASYSFM